MSCSTQRTKARGKSPHGRRSAEHTVSISHLYRGDALPALQDFDALVIMGGEMNIYQYRDWPWLQPESELIQAALRHGKPAVGICLGAQFLADALGSRVVQNPVYELGWFPVFWTAESRDWFPNLPSGGPVLHWHGDRFSLPMGATRLAISLGCHEQGFIVPGKALALQFHMEVNPALVKLYVESQGKLALRQVCSRSESDSERSREVL